MREMLLQRIQFFLKEALLLLLVAKLVFLIFQLLLQLCRVLLILTLTVDYPLLDNSLRIR